MDLSIILINWNSVNFLRKCLQSVFRNTRDIEFEVVVLDNGSFDGCGEMLARDFPKVRFIQSDKNLGFARGNNLAASHCRGSGLLFLNPDTEILGSALNILYNSVIATPNAGAVGARLINSDGTLQTSCLQAFPRISNRLLDSNLLERWFPNARLWGMAPLFGKSESPVEVEGISGACLLTPRDVFLKVGGFTEDYFMYYEDMDYCLKIVRSGWKNYFIPNAVVLHHKGKSGGGEYSRFSIVMMAESGWRFFYRQEGYYYALMFRGTLAAKAALSSCLFAMLSILAFPKSRRNRARGGLRKWTHLLRWCLGAERWVKNYR